MVTAPALSFHPKLGSSGFYSSSIISLSTKYYYGDEFNQTIIKFGTFYKGATSVYRADFLLENEGMGESHLSYCDTVIGTRVSSSYGCAFYPKPGAVCERFSTGYASSQMRDTSVIKSIIKSLIPLKTLTPSLHNFILKSGSDATPGLNSSLKPPTLSQILLETR